MKSFYSILLLAIIALPMMAADDVTVQIPVSSDMGHGRYEYIESTIARKGSFLIDKYEGRVWKVVRSSEYADNQMLQEVYIDKPADSPSDSIRYQLYMGGMMFRDCFLVNIYTGEVWVYTRQRDTDYCYFSRMARKDGTLSPGDAHEAEVSKKMRGSRGIFEQNFAPEEGAQEYLEKAQHLYELIIFNCGNHGKLYSTFATDYRAVYEYLYCNPTLENARNLLKISEYARKVNLQDTYSKLEKSLQQATDLQDKIQVFLSRASK